MSTKFDTSLLDRAQRARRLADESHREDFLQRAREALNELSQAFVFDKAWLFGSITKASRFRPDSDVDVAVQGLPSEHYLAMAAKLANLLERDVDLEQIEKCAFADRIKREGIEWKPVR